MIKGIQRSNKEYQGYSKSNEWYPKIISDIDNYFLTSHNKILYIQNDLRVPNNEYQTAGIYTKMKTFQYGTFQNISKVQNEERIS